MKAKPAFLVSLVCASVAFCPLARADETVSFSDAPDVVQKAIQAQTGDGKMGDITKSAEDEETVYDVDLTARDGSERDFSVAEDGTLLSIEVTIGETPAAAQETIKSELNGGDLESIDKNLDDTDITYDVEGTGKDGNEIVFTVDDDGTLSSKEADLSDAPDPVRQTIAAQLNGGKVSEIDENFDDDGTNFDVTVTNAEGVETSFNVTAEGTLASKEVAPADLPGRARATIRKRIGDGTVVRVDKSFEKRGKFFPYEVEGRKDGKPFDFSVAPGGRFLGMDN